MSSLPASSPPSPGPNACPATRSTFELSALAGFDDHNAFSGVMFGSEGLDHRFEFTRCPSREVSRRRPKS
ncbi:hypothetical protein [Burkholderia territorii]|uniref:hypothetical protein n=1 Tax=Burkholderia territorii TaxID=1503055 RepID=UPI000B0CE035